TGKNGWRFEISHNSKTRGGGGRRGGGGGGHGRSGGGGSDLKCYEYGEPVHFSRECHSSRGFGEGGRCRSCSPPRLRRSPSYGLRSYSPRERSPRRQSPSPRCRSPSPRRCSYSRSPPPYRGREAVAHANGNGLRDAPRSKS
ncbi:serine/arginine-rich splicing factor RSZ22-like, partial [Vicia villosa]|uniref:serine/arginine-rich splicing factor RSZ22-like n=1 Tax=Vicia villosa TaxID=3911 RepID=UPI00273A8FB6